MMLDREYAKNAFAAYTANYDVNDEKVKLKIEHTYRVANLCERIAKEIGLSEEDVELAWASGLLHDVGRFEQLRLYGTFNDMESVDHAQCGADILFKEGKIRDYIQDHSEDELLEKVIRCHNAYEIPKDYSKRLKIFAQVLRDADKIDILKVNVEVPLEEIYNVSTQTLKQAKVTEAVMEAFARHETVLRSIKRTAVDHVVGHISLVYGLVYPCSLKIVAEQGYLEKIMNFVSMNEETNKHFQEIREVMHLYLEKNSTGALTLS